MKTLRNSPNLMLKKVRPVVVHESCPTFWQLCGRNCCYGVFVHLISVFNILYYFSQNQHCLSVHQREGESVAPNHQSNIEVNKTCNVQYVVVFSSGSRAQILSPFLIYLFIFIFTCIFQVMVPSSSGSFFLSFLSMLNAQTWSSGPRKRITSSKSFSPQQWQRCGVRKRTSLPWTTRSWAVVSATIMARVSSKRSMAKDMCTSSCAIFPRSWAMIPWWTSAKISWRIRSVENQWCRLKLKISLFPLQLKMVNLRDLSTLAFCSSFPFVFVDNPNVFYFGNSFCSLYQALNRQY